MPIRIDHPFSFASSERLVPDRVTVSLADIVNIHEIREFHGAAVALSPHRNYRVVSRQFDKLIRLERGVGDLLFSKAAIAACEQIRIKTPNLAAKFSQSDRSIFEQAHALYDWEYVSIRALFETSILAFNRAFDKKSGSPIKFEEIKDAVRDDVLVDTANICRAFRHENAAHSGTLAFHGSTFFSLGDNGQLNVYFNTFNSSSLGGAVFARQLNDLIETILAELYEPRLRVALKDCCEKIARAICRNSQGQLCMPKGSYHIADDKDYKEYETIQIRQSERIAVRFENGRLILEVGNLQASQLKENFGVNVV